MKRGRLGCVRTMMNLLLVSMDLSSENQIVTRFSQGSGGEEALHWAGPPDAVFLNLMCCTTYVPVPLTAKVKICLFFI